MDRTLELYADGHLHEYKGDQAVQYTDTQGNVDVIAVRQLQEQKGLKIDGIAGGDTRTTLGL